MQFHALTLGCLSWFIACIPLIDKSDFDRRCVEKYGTVLEHLSKADASQVIAQLAA